jgi:hypothetical protein
VKLDFSPATWKKVVRTFVAAFVGLYGGSNLIGVISGSQPLDPTALRAAAAAGFIAVVTLLWNAFLDPSPVPSLRVNPEDHDEP